MTPREIEEYRALRATIRQRGSLRVGLFFTTLVAWAAAAIATAALATLPVATLLPLLLLAAGFEGMFSLHTGVERIGRYLQVFYGDDEASPPDPTRSRAEAGSRVADWERTAMAYGQRYPGGPDPLFASYFVIATVLNFVPVLLAEPVRIELTVVGLAHLLVVGRVLLARHASAGQRAKDLERFQRLKQDSQAVR